MADKFRSVLVVLFPLIATGGAIYACLLHRVLWVLVPLPGLVGVLYHVLSLQGRYQDRASVVAQYRQFLLDFHRTWGRPSPPAEVNETGTDDLAPHQPKFSQTFWAAAVLTAVLCIPAAVSKGGLLLIDGKLSGGEEGLVFAGLGVYTLIVLRTIGRLNSGPLQAHRGDARHGGPDARLLRRPGELFPAGAEDRGVPRRPLLPAVRRAAEGQGHRDLQPQEVGDGGEGAAADRRHRRRHGRHPRGARYGRRAAHGQRRPGRARSEERRV